MSRSLCQVLVFIACGVCCIALGSGCDGAAGESSSERASAARVASEAETGASLRPLATAYPAGRWRLALPDELEHTSISAAHIQISHRDVVPRVASFHLPEWSPRSENPGRSREEAFQIAQGVAARARAAPARFADLARELSDDVATRELGGDLGGMSALALARWPEILDALAALQDDEVSQVIETEFGFHVLLKRPPPPPEVVSGARLIIAYDEAPWLRWYLARQAIPPRSRAEALRLAETLSDRLQSHPEEFASAVERYSDHRDALRGGDFGQSSLRETTPWFRERSVLRRLAVGQVSRPLDSRLGVEILQRTPERPRRTYALRALRVRYATDAGQAGLPSLEAARHMLSDIAARLPSEPALFDAERARHCCEPTQAWIEGSGNVLEEVALERLAPGEIGLEPLLGTTTVSLLQRLEPHPAAAPPTRVELPSPRAPNVEWAVGTYGTPQMLRAVSDRARAAWGADSPDAEPSQAEADRFSEAPNLEQRLLAFDAYQGRLRQTLGAELFARYRSTFESYLEERLSRPRRIGRSKTGLPHSSWPLLP